LNKRTSISTGLLAFLVITAVFTASVKANSWPNLPTSPVTLVVFDGINSYFVSTLSNVPIGYDVSNGVYAGWCVDRRYHIPRGENVTVVLNSSLSPPVDLQSESWDMVNYIINHKQGHPMMDVQWAIWYFVNLAPYLVNDPMDPNNGYGMTFPGAVPLINDAIANGDGYVPGEGELLAIICYPNTPTQISIIELLKPPTTTGATRTIGFWQTHTSFTKWVFDNKLSGSIPIDSSTPHAKIINTYGKLFGAFYCSIPKNTDHSDRPGIDQNRTILLQQLVGAILNHAASGVTVPIDPVTGNDLITAGNLAYSSDNGTEMLRVKDLLDTFNGSGEIIAFPAGFPPQGSATPQASKAIADKAFWDSPL